MGDQRGYNICQWLKNGKHEICGKYCREEYCIDHSHKIRNGKRIVTRPCLDCGIGTWSQRQLCRGCRKERRSRSISHLEKAPQRTYTFENRARSEKRGVRDKCDTVYMTENEFCFGLRD